MGLMTIFSATLGLSMPWLVTAAVFARGSNRLDISVEYAWGPLMPCPKCGAHTLPKVIEAVAETWYHNDFLNYATYLHVRIPRPTCPGDCLSPERPWCRAGSRFKKLP
jgi:hypothetical protein